MFAALMLARMHHMRFHVQHGTPSEIAMTLAFYALVALAIRGLLSLACYCYDRYFFQGPADVCFVRRKRAKKVLKTIAIWGFVVPVCVLFVVGLALQVTQGLERLKSYRDRQREMEQARQESKCRTVDEQRNNDECKRIDDVHTADLAPEDNESSGMSNTDLMNDILVRRKGRLFSQ